MNGNYASAAESMMRLRVFIIIIVIFYANYACAEVDIKCLNNQPAVRDAVWTHCAHIYIFLSTFQLISNGTLALLEREQSRYRYFQDDKQLFSSYDQLQSEFAHFE